MNITEILAQAGGLRSIARELGVSESQASAGAEALIPAILAGFKKRAQGAVGGLDGLGGLLNQLGGAVLLDNVLSTDPTDVRLGNDVLGEIFGSKDVSRSVAQEAATHTGLAPALLKKMLPMLAMLVVGIMSRQAGGASRSGGALGGLLGMLDQDGNGNPLDDIVRMAGKALR